MSFLKGLLWFLAGLTLIALAMYLTGNYAFADYLTSSFLYLQPYLPLQVDFDQFLVGVTVLSLLIVAIVVVGAGFVIVTATGRMAATSRRSTGEATAARQESAHLRDQQQRALDDLLAMSRSLTRRLDKRVLVQGIVEAASRATSTAQTNSAVALWLLRFDTDTLQFEGGRYCDESVFTQAEYQPTDASFARVMTTQKPCPIPAWKGVLTCVRPDKERTIAATPAALMVPLIIEEAVLGVLLVFCHPDVVKGYETQQAYYNAVWGQLTLAFAIAVQGELAILDRLTGTHNREYFMKRLVQEIDRANRHQFPLSLLMVDIDNFKAVNDALGHPQGDAVLKIIAKLIRKETRAIDLVGRYGGEEFILLLPETGLGEEGTSATGALVVAERIRKAVEDEFKGMLKPLNLTVSVGLTVRRFPEDRTADHRELIRLADEQLYKSKTTGKNKVTVHVASPQEAA